MNNTTINIGIVDAHPRRTETAGAAFNPAFCVEVGGYTAAEIGIASAVQMARPPRVPAISAALPQGMSVAFTGPVLAERPGLHDLPQRFTFPFSIKFSKDAMFGPSPVTVPLMAFFTAGGVTVSSRSSITLMPVGKIDGIIYDRSGDFEALILKTCHGDIKRFETREPRIALVARRAWKERLPVLIVADSPLSSAPASVLALG